VNIGSIGSYPPVTATFQPASSAALSDVAAAVALENQQTSVAAVEALDQVSAQLSGTAVDISV
jgi:hypothetical protein